MRKVCALVLLLLLAACAALAEEAAPVLICSNALPRPVAVVLPGMPMTVTGQDSDWIYLRCPDLDMGSETGRISADTELWSTFDTSGWPEAEIVTEDADFNSMDLNLYYGALPKGTKVKVAGRCLNAWYVLVDDGEATRLGAVYLDDVMLNEADAAMLNSLLPDMPTTMAEVAERLEAWEALSAALAEQYGTSDETYWPQEVRAAADEQQWQMGNWWNDDYAVQPTGNDVTMAAALEAVRLYLRDVLHIPAVEDGALNAQFLQAYGAAQAVWHVYWDVLNERFEFIVTGRAGVPADAGWVQTDCRQLYVSRACMDWPIETRAVLAEICGYGAVDDDQRIAEGMLDEETARDLAWQYAMEQLEGVHTETHVLMLRFYDVGTVLTYDWPWETWCEERPVFRANIYSAYDLIPAGEVWFDGETGEVYRISTESSGLG